MGTYYKLLNLTKKQQYEPANKAVKYGNFIWYAEEIVGLLLGEWHGDQVRMVNDGADEDYHGPDEADPPWPVVTPPLYRAAGDDGESSSRLRLDRNGMTKLLEAFVRAFGPAAVAVALDEATEKAGTEIK